MWLTSIAQLVLQICQIRRGKSLSDIRALQNWKHVLATNNQDMNLQLTQAHPANLSKF